MKSSSPDPEIILPVLVSLGTGEIEADEAALAVGMSIDDLMTFLAANPTVRSEADRRCRDIKLSPEHIAKTSLAGLSTVAEKLALRAKEDGDHLSVSELQGIGTLLDRISAMSASTAQQAKNTSIEERTSAATMIIDERPLPDGQLGFRIWHLPENHPAMIDADDRFDSREPEERRRARVMTWIARWFPMDSLNNAHDVGSILGKGGRLLDGATGQWYPK